MNPEPISPEDLPPPGRYGTMNWMGVAKSVNAVYEEATWPRGRAVPPKLGMVILTPSENINPTDEELTWPIVPGGEVYELPPEVLPPPADRSK